MATEAGAPMTAARPPASRQAGARSQTGARGGSASGTGASRRECGSPQAGSTWSASTPTTTRDSCCPSRSARALSPPRPGARTTCSRCGPGGTRRRASRSRWNGCVRLRRGPGRGPGPDGIPGWARYPAGVAWSLLSAGYPVAGVSLAIDSCLADGAGLSSSAALECSVALALTELNGAGGVHGAGDLPARPGRHRAPGRERVRRRAVRDHGPVRRPCCAGRITRCCWTASRWSPARYRSPPPRPGSACW